MSNGTVLHFDKVVGQANVKRFLNNAYANDRMAHSYLFIGDDGVGKLAQALEFAKALLCSAETSKPCQACHDCQQVGQLVHPNLIFIFAHPKSAKDEEKNTVIESVVEQPYLLPRLWANPSISIDTIRELKRSLSTRSLQGRNRVIIIVGAEDMGAEAANALLKLLEEPPKQTYFVLLTSAPDNLLPTIISRCQQLRFESLTIQEIEDGLRQMTALDQGAVRLVARMARGSLRQALELATADTQELKNTALELLRAAFKNPSQMASHVTNFCDKNDRRYTKDVLESLLLWLRDMFMVANLGWQIAQRYLTNLDEQTTLERFVESFPQYDYPRAISEVEQSVRMLDRYVQPNLVLVVLLQKLRTFSVTERQALVA